MLVCRYSLFMASHIKHSMNIGKYEKFALSQMRIRFSVSVVQLLRDFPLLQFTSYTVQSENEKENKEKSNFHLQEYLTKSQHQTNRINCINRFFFVRSFLILSLFFK